MREFKADEYATRAFVVSMCLIGAWIAAAFSFVILAD
jgi:hypothetical protein